MIINASCYFCWVVFFQNIFTNLVSFAYQNGPLKSFLRYGGGKRGLGTTLMQPDPACRGRDWITPVFPAAL